MHAATISQTNTKHDNDTNHDDHCIHYTVCYPYFVAVLVIDIAKRNDDNGEIREFDLDDTLSKIINIEDDEDEDTVGY